MQVPQYTQSGTVGFNMTPMIDVVFLLIIFFLVSSHLARQETRMPLPLPDAASGDRPGEPQTAQVTLNIQDDGSLVLAGRRVDLAELGRRLQVLSKQNEQVEVRIRGDRRVVYGKVAPVLSACTRSGVWNVTFAVYRPEDVQ